MKIDRVELIKELRKKFKTIESFHSLSFNEKTDLVRSTLIEMGIPISIINAKKNDKSINLNKRNNINNIAKKN